MPDLPVPSKWRVALTIVVVVVAILCVLAVGGLLKGIYDGNAKLRTEITEFKNLTDNLVRSSTKWATRADLDDKLKGMLTSEDREVLRKDLSDLRASLVAVGRTVGSLGRKVSSPEGSTSEGAANPNVEKCQDGRSIDTHGYTRAPQNKELTDTNTAPLASVTFDASRDKPWKYSVYERQFHLSTAVGRQESGQLSFHHTLDYSVPEKSGEKYRIKLASSEYLQVPESRRMFWWNPLLDVGVFTGASIHPIAALSDRSDGVFSFGAELGISFSSYGRTMADNLWRFLRIGLGYDAERKTGHLSFSPAALNIGDPLPLLTNLWVYPYVGIDTGGGLLLGGGLGFQL